MSGVHRLTWMLIKCPYLSGATWLKWNYRGRNFNRNSGATRMKPVLVSSGEGIFEFSGTAISKFCRIPAKTRNSVFFANVSPAQTRFPTPNANCLSNLAENCPASSKNRSGLNSSGCSQTCLSTCAPYSDGNAIVPYEKNLLKFNLLNGRFP